MKSHEIPKTFRIKIENYFNDKLKKVEDHGDNLSIDGILFPKKTKTTHLKLDVLCNEHINAMTELLYLLDIFHNFSLNNNIIYSILYGNLLGYHRENGHIAWDDDIDLILPDKHGIEILLNLWKNGGEEYKIWDRNWTYKNITLNNTNIILVKMTRKNNWFKLRLNATERVNRGKFKDFGGIDITFSNDKGKDFVGTNVKYLSNYKSDDINYPIVKYGPIYTRALSKEPSVKFLNERYGKSWINKNHPSLNYLK